MTTTHASTVGPMIRAWSSRGKSQLALAVEAGISTRHLSFVETGRASPSRDMVLTLAEHLDVPLRERNVLLEAAGYAAVFRETPLDAAAMTEVRGALAHILDASEPNPTLVVNPERPDLTALSSVRSDPEPDLRGGRCGASIAGFGEHLRGGKSDGKRRGRGRPPARFGGSGERELRASLASRARVQSCRASRLAVTVPPGVAVTCNAAERGPTSLDAKPIKIEQLAWPARTPVHALERTENSVAAAPSSTRSIGVMLPAGTSPAFDTLSSRD